jgi:hypothetical protein
MASARFALLLLVAWLLPGAPAEVALPPIQAIALDAPALLADPSLLASDILALRVTSRGQAAYKLSERGEVLAAGMLLPGENTVRFARPGLCAGSQSILLLLEAFETGAPQQKFIRLQVAVAVRTAAVPAAPALSGNFNLEMYHAGRLIGFRRKRMQDLVQLTTGPGTLAANPLDSASFRPQSSGNSVSVLGVAMALAKHLAKKKAAKEMGAQAAEIRKRRLETTVVRAGPNGAKSQVPIVIELRTE